MRVSDAGVALVKEFEGFVGHPYRDVVGVWTIGYGHTHGVNSSTPHISEAQASDLLRQDLDRAYAPAVNALKLPLTQHQFDALVSFVYNVGPGGVASSTHVGRALRAHHWREAADALLEWNKAGGRENDGLTRRRHQERALFLTGDHTHALVGYTEAEIHMIRAYDELVRKGYKSTAAAQRLRSGMIAQRKRIWKAAQGTGGWSRAHRRERYHSLLVRTR
jgi:lysozyme